jgi:hypothetical protein
MNEKPKNYKRVDNLLIQYGSDARVMARVQKMIYQCMNQTDRFTSENLFTLPDRVIYTTLIKFYLKLFYKVFQCKFVLIIFRVKRG